MMLLQVQEMGGGENERTGGRGKGKMREVEGDGGDLQPR